MLQRRELLAALAGAMSLPLLGRSTKPVSDVALLNGALELEHMAVYAYDLAGGAKLLSAPALGVAQLFKGSHEAHREALGKAIKNLGGFPINPEKQYRFEAFELRTEIDVLRLALFLELKAVRAYRDALSRFRHRDLALAAGRILADEASHATTLRAALGKGPVAFAGQLDEGLD